MLAGVDEDLTKRTAGAERLDERRNLHVVRPGADDMDDGLHLERVMRWYWDCDTHPGGSCAESRSGSRSVPFTTDRRGTHAGEASDTSMP